MNWPFIQSVAFGFVLAGVVVLSYLWTKVLLDGDYTRNRKYVTVTLGLVIANFGVGMLIVSRIADIFGGREIAPFALAIAAIVMGTGKTIWLAGSVMGNSKKPLYIWGAMLSCWIVFCVWWWL